MVIDGATIGLHRVLVLKFDFRTDVGHYIVPASRRLRQCPRWVREYLLNVIVTIAGVPNRTSGCLVRACGA